jgi:hypothetical protein
MQSNAPPSKENPMKRNGWTKTAIVASVCALVGAAGGIAGVSAATSGSSGATGASGATGSNGAQPATPPQRGGPGDHDGGPRGPHRGANGPVEKPLSADTAAQVKAAALKKVDGTVERVETDADHGSPYEAHIRKSDGTEYEVLVDSGFNVTAVNQMQHP